MSSEPLLRLHQVTKRFAGLTVLEDVGFAVRQGEIIGLVGPNGSGKTTTINLISGIHHPDHGTITFAGTEVQAMATFRRSHLGINRTFQVPKSFRDMTVRENVLVGARFGAKGGTNPDAILDELGLTALRDAIAGSLTVNQQKMLDLARALAAAPRLLLVDEIGAGLNPAELSAMATVLERLAARGIALIVVEHLLDFLNRITNRVIVLSAGRMLFEGTLRAASENSEVVAAFIGGEPLGAA